MRFATLLRPPPSAKDRDKKPTMIGLVGTPREQEAGYRLHPDYWGKGYMTEAFGMFLKLFWESEGVFSWMSAPLKL